MATERPISSSEAWEIALTRFQEAEATAQQRFKEDGLSAENSAAWQFLEDSRQTFLKLPAPDVRGVVQKLEALWGEELFSDDGEAPYRQKIIGDLRRIEFKLVTGENPPGSVWRGD